MVLGSRFGVQGSAQPLVVERPVKSKKKLMNIEHRTFNIEHRIMNSVYFKKAERSDIHHSTIVIP
jgi:hypothetical protein